MSKIPTPSRGQPIDLSYIYQIVETVNGLSESISSSTAKYTNIDNAESGSTDSVRTSDARVVGAYIPVTNNSGSSSEGDVSVSYTYEDFRFPPIVTASVRLLGDASVDAGKDATVILTQVTTNRVEFIVRFNSTEDISVGVNLLAVGIPV